MILSPNLKFNHRLLQPLQPLLTVPSVFLALLLVIDNRKWEKDYKEVDESLAAIEVMFSHAL